MLAMHHMQLNYMNEGYTNYGAHGYELLALYNIKFLPFPYFN